MLFTARLADLIDTRGSIEFICDEPIGGVQRITSKAGTTRSNHYHKTDWHILYVVSGEMHLWEKEVQKHRISPAMLRAGEDALREFDIEHDSYLKGAARIWTVMEAARPHVAHRVFKPGEYVRTGPRIEHTTKFPVDTVLLCFSGSNRNQEAYENDVVRTQDLSAL